MATMIPRDIEEFGTEGEKAFYPGSGNHGFLAGISPRLGFSQVPRLRAETHFGVQARPLSIGLHNFLEEVAKLIRFVGLSDE